MVGNAHIDPVWLWRWQAGVDEALASFRSAADRCDEYPGFVYTRGESWLYEEVEKIDPGRLARARRRRAEGAAGAGARAGGGGTRGVVGWGAAPHLRGPVARDGRPVRPAGRKRANGDGAA